MRRGLEVVCIGGAVADRKLHLLAPSVAGTSNPARSSAADGGVARNVAQVLALLGVPVALVSRVGDDEAGTALLARLDGHGVDRSAVEVDPEAATAQYVAVLEPDGALVIGVADMAVLERIEVRQLDAVLPGGSAGSGGWVMADCNLPPDVLAALVSGARRHGRRLCVDATSTPKVVRLPRDLTGVGVLFCNRDEAAAWLGRQAPSDADDVLLAECLRGAGAAAVVLTRGAGGVLLLDPDGVRALPALPVPVLDVTGAGDALVAGTVAGLSRGWTLDAAAGLGVRLAALTVGSERSVVAEVPEVLRAELASSRLTEP